MKRLLALFLALFLLGGLTACGSQSYPETETTNGSAGSPAVEAPEESGMAEPGIRWFGSMSIRSNSRA